MTDLCHDCSGDGGARSLCDVALVRECGHDDVLASAEVASREAESQATHHLPNEAVVLERVDAFVQLQRAALLEHLRELEVLLLHPD